VLYLSRLADTGGDVRKKEVILQTKIRLSSQSFASVKISELLSPRQLHESDNFLPRIQRYPNPFPRTTFMKEFGFLVSDP
jgi:hypothetical protein